mmetsp:Transcript_9187/g.22725  ORF Transcript_9187/g.22725 Transcript_9187/m.22725 type:complete len:248 (-) Transcript_9187:7-750(-)
MQAPPSASAGDLPRGAMPSPGSLVRWVFAVKVLGGLILLLGGGVHLVAVLLRSLLQRLHPIRPLLVLLILSDLHSGLCLGGKAFLLLAVPLGAELGDEDAELGRHEVAKRLLNLLLERIPLFELEAGFWLVVVDGDLVEELALQVPLVRPARDVALEGQLQLVVEARELLALSNVTPRVPVQLLHLRLQLERKLLRLGREGEAVRVDLVEQLVQPLLAPGGVVPLLVVVRVGVPAAPVRRLLGDLDA